MKMILIAVVMGLSLAGVRGQDAKEKETAAKTEKPKLSQQELEKQFQTTLTKATLTGRWCGVNNGRLGSEKKDQYTIQGVSKLSGDQWLLKARIQYGSTDLVAPIPVQVKWAGDTAVIIVDNFALPGSGAYSARVMIHENTYAGTWSAEDHGGLLSGVISQTKEE
jgi:hypothetical protein